MNRRAITIIIALMTVSLLGTAVVQSFWIRKSVLDLEMRFDDNVYKVLLNTAEYLELQDRKRNESTRKNLVPSYSKYGITQREAELRGLSDTRGDLLIGAPEEKIDIQALSDYVKKEMESVGITAEYHYAVKSKRTDAFLFIDDYYVVQESSSGNSSPAFEESPDQHDFHQKSSYSRDLFGTVGNPRAEIIMYFPQRRQFIWKSALPFLLLVFLFLLLILACFVYTIWVILRQKKVSEMKTDFINNMTHEFKTPIATISLATDSITSPKVIAAPDRIQRFAQIIKQENARMLSQVEKVLQMALVDKSNFELKIIEVDIHAIIEQAVEHTRLKVEQRGGLIHMELNAERTTIQGDQTHIGNMIYNLLDNANKYTPQEPRITVSTENKPGGVVVSVADNGIGLSSEAKKYIFDKFYRVHTGNLHDVKGFGLGLSYVKSLMTAHQGRIEVKSELNKGSKFSLFFPYEQNQA